jgi:hypothetical protein
MLRAVILSLLVLGGAAGCGKSQIRAFDGHGCSTKPDDDPLYVCSPQYDLVCINTYYKEVTDPVQAKAFDGGIRSVYVCRLVCDPASGIGCAETTDVCCPGFIHGKTYGKTHACVPDYLCQTRGPGDGGAGVDGPAPEGPRPMSDAGAAVDAGGLDAAVDQ